MNLATLIILIIVLVPLSYLLYFWVYSEILKDDEINDLASAQRFWDTCNYLGFTESQCEVNKEFKSALNKNGQLYNCNESLNNFPSVAPNPTTDYINKIANDGGADMVLEFHNHPNALLSASQQDITSANYFGKIFTDNRLNFLAFVSGAGRFHQYGWWFIDTFCNINNYLENIKKDNGTSRSVNFDLRKDLKRKKYFKDFRLNNNSSHNIAMKRNNVLTQDKSFQNISSKENEMDYLEKVLKEFKIDLNLFPEPNYNRIEKMENMGDEKNETWSKYYYKLSVKEFELFEDLELINHSATHNSFIFSTNTFNINNLKYLVSIFYKIFGVDSLGEGEFNDEDFNQITSSNFWFGRIWSDSEKYKCAVMISFGNEGNKLDLSVKW